MRIATTKPHQLNPVQLYFIFTRSSGVGEGRSDKPRQIEAFIFLFNIILIIRHTKLIVEANREAPKAKEKGSHSIVFLFLKYQYYHSFQASPTPSLASYLPSVLLLCAFVRCLMVILLVVPCSGLFGCLLWSLG